LHFSAFSIGAIIFAGILDFLRLYNNFRMLAVAIFELFLSLWIVNFFCAVPSIG